MKEIKDYDRDDILDDLFLLVDALIDEEMLDEDIASDVYEMRQRWRELLMEDEEY